MSTFTSGLSQLCKRCSRPLVSGTLECENCHALVHADEMERRAAQARELEARHQFLPARDWWLSILPLIPPNSKQAEWIREHAREVETAAQEAEAAKAGHATRSRWAKRLAPLAPLALILAKAKTFLLLIFKLKFLLSFAAFIAVYWQFFGPKFGVGFAVLILIHEMGHFVEIKRRGLPADMPVFLPGLGAYVRWNAMGVTKETQSLIALAGPCAGFLAAAGCAMVWKATGDPLWAALARTGAWFNVLNLAPVFILDGGRAADSLNLWGKMLLLGAGAGMYFATHDLVFVFVAAGAGWRVVSEAWAARKTPSARYSYQTEPPGPQQVAIANGVELSRESSPLVAAYFIGLLAALGVVMWLMPGHGNGLP